MKNFFKRLWQINTARPREVKFDVPDTAIREITRDELYELYKSGLITELHIEPLLRGEEISTVSTDMYS